MISPKQKSANRLNAQRSTGPRTELGRRQAALNSYRHGLTSPIDSTLWASKLGVVESMLHSEGLCDAEIRELSLRLVEYERNVVHQRKLYLESLAGAPFAHAILEGAHAQLDISDYLGGVMSRGDSSLSGLPYPLARELQKFFDNASPGQIRKAKSDAAKELKTTDRYLRRAANQLIKALKNI